MKYLIMAVLVPYIAASDCNKSKLSTPACIQDRIQQIKAQPKQNPPGEVNEYIYQDKHVYLFVSPCCDQYNIAYDANCNPVCAPTGGYTGKGDGQCPDFNDQAKWVRLVWKDER